jgi:hypothetical protein
MFAVPQVLAYSDVIGKRYPLEWLGRQLRNTVVTAPPSRHSRPPDGSIVPSHTVKQRNNPTTYVYRENIALFG